MHDSFCISCWAQLNHLENPDFAPPSCGYNFSVFSLYQWNQGVGFEVHNLIHGLKGQHHRAAYQRLGWRMSLALNSSPTNRILIPCPAKKGPDHATFLAEGIGASLGFSVSPLLSLLRPHLHQKEQALVQRKERKMVWLGPALSESMTPTFVDDVVTSGGTAKAAWRALGYPAKFEVWALACRPRFKLL